MNRWQHPNNVVGWSEGKKGNIRKLITHFQWKSKFEWHNHQPCILVLWNLYLNFWWFNHFHSSFSFGFRTNIWIIDVAHVTTRWFWMVYFCHFLTIKLIYLGEWWILFYERVEDRWANYFKWYFNCYIVLWYGSEVTRGGWPHN